MLNRKKHPTLKSNIFCVVGMVAILAIFNFLSSYKNLNGYLGISLKNSEEELYRHIDLHAQQQHMYYQRRALINQSSVVHQGFRENDQIESLFFQDFFGDDIEVVKEWKSMNESDRNAYLTDFANGERGDMIYGRLCNAILLFKEIKGVRKHVLVSQLNANWGALSSYVPNRTTDWGNWEDHFTSEGCTIDDFWWYINHPNVSAVFTTTHQWLDHPKIIAVPLGVDSKERVAQEVALQEMDNRTELLLISQSAAPWRVEIAEHIIANFNRSIRNRYKDNLDFWHDLRHSKFIMCPSGVVWAGTLTGHGMHCALVLFQSWRLQARWNATPL